MKEKYIKTDQTLRLCHNLEIQYLSSISRFDFRTVVDCLLFSICQDHCRPAEDERGSTGSLPDTEGHVRRSEDR